jgi:hypothetical protein
MLDNENLRLEFSKRLNEALDEAGVRVRGRATDIAAEITIRVDKVSPAACGLWLKGETEPNTLHLRALAKWLDVRLEWLQYGTLPKRGTAKIDTKIPRAGPKVLRLAARIADLERRGKLSNELIKALNAVLDTAKA